MLVVVGWIYLAMSVHYHSHSVEHSERIRFRSLVCSLNSSSLRSLVWSHKGHVEGLVDGSRVAVAKLLKGGIVKYDVDVVNSDRGFLVAHPATLKAASSDEVVQMQTITELLQQVHEGFNYRPDSHLAPMVSVEPKFRDLVDLNDLVTVLEESPMRHRIAIIVADKEQLHYVLHRVRHISVALPFKSYVDPSITVDNQFHWSESAGGLLSVVGGNHRHTDIMRLNELLMVIHMPDIKLLGVSDGSSRAGPVVAWIVDTPADLDKVLSRSVPVDGFISNRPLEQLFHLNAQHAELCHDG